MKILALLLLAAAPARMVLLDEVVRVSPGDVKGLNLSLEQKHAVIETEYEVVGSGRGITVALVGPGDGRGSPMGGQRYLRQAKNVRGGSIRYPAAQLGTYQVVLDNRGDNSGPVEVKLSVSVIFDEPGTLRPVQVQPMRRSVVIASSLALFLAICFWSGSLVLRSFRERR